jgi:hypothetical protein
VGGDLPARLAERADAVSPGRVSRCWWRPRHGLIITAASSTSQEDRPTCIPALDLQ